MEHNFITLEHKFSGHVHWYPHLIVGPTVTPEYASNICCIIVSCIKKSLGQVSYYDSSVWLVVKEGDPWLSWLSSLSHSPAPKTRLSCNISSLMIWQWLLGLSHNRPQKNYINTSCILIFTVYDVCILARWCRPMAFMETVIETSHGTQPVKKQGNYHIKHEHIPFHGSQFKKCLH